MDVLPSVLLGCTRQVKSAVVMGRVSSRPLSRRKASLCLTALPHMAISMPQRGMKALKSHEIVMISTPNSTYCLLFKLFRGGKAVFL